MTLSLDLMANRLFSRGPADDIPEAQRLFAPLIGSWELDVSWYDAQGTRTRRESGEWHFAWVLGGRGIQDVWIVPGAAERAAGRELYEHGTSIRFYDPQIAAWRSTWIGPRHGAIVLFIGRSIGNAIVLETQPPSEKTMRWSFHDITPDSFTWKNHLNVGGNWRLTQDFTARRQA